MKKFFASLLCVMMVFCMMPSMAFAEGTGTSEPQQTAVPVAEVTDGKITLENGESRVLSGTFNTSITVDGEGTLYLRDLTIDTSSDASEQDALTVEGNVNLIIEDTVSVTAGKGSAITGPVLNISGTGNLTAIAGDAKGAFGIGGMNTQKISISGVTITEVIGGFDGQIGNDTKYYKDAPEGGAAIGSGTDGATITLNGVHIVKAIGGSKAAGIGARYHVGMTVNIENCLIDYVEGGATAAAIGGSRVSGDKTESGTTINIVNSTIKAQGGVYAAGIGSGYDTHCGTDQPLCKINIDGSTITATGGTYAAGIGTGFHNAALSGEIKNSTITAVSGEKFYKDDYTRAQDIGFGVVDPAREAKDNDSYIINNGNHITIVATSGVIWRAYLDEANSRIVIDAGKIDASESVEFKLYYNDELLTTSSLKPEKATSIKGELTASIYTDRPEDSIGDSWIRKGWVAQDTKMPTRIDLVIDGEVLDSETVIQNKLNSGVEMSDQEWIDFPGTKAVSEAIASIGDAYYYSLQDAFDAVPTDGTKTTVKILKDMELDADDMSYVSLLSNVYGKYKAYFAGNIITGQNVVLDMNGKSISLTYNKEYNSETIYGGCGIIGVQGGGELTVTGNGSMTLNGAGTSVIWSTSIGSKATVLNGTFASVYEENPAYTPNVVYASHGGELYVKGGTFNHGYIDTDLGVSGAVVKDMSCPDRTANGNNGAKTVVEVTGGTFQGVDPDKNCPELGTDGVWRNVDVVPSGYVSVDNGDGTWTVQKKQTTPSTPSYSGGSVSIQKPTIEADEGIDWTLNTLGTKVTITVKEGYELADVTLNGVGVGKVTELKNLKTGDKVYISAVKVTDENEAMIEKVKNTKLVARSQMSSAKDKRAVKVRWFAKDGSSIDWLEGFEVFRSSKRYEGYTQKAFFKTERKAYWNTLIKSGNKYYYKVRGYVTIDGVKCYTDWSLKAWRTVK